MYFEFSSSFRYLFYKTCNYLVVDLIRSSRRSSFSFIISKRLYHTSFELNIVNFSRTLPLGPPLKPLKGSQSTQTNNCVLFPISWKTQFFYFLANTLRTFCTLRWEFEIAQFDCNFTNNPDFFKKKFKNCWISFFYRTPLDGTTELTVLRKYARLLQVMVSCKFPVRMCKFCKFDYKFNQTFWRSSRLFS